MLEKLDLSAPVVIALASSSGDYCTQLQKFRFVKHFWGTIFNKENLPDIKLEKISLKVLESDVAPSGIFEDVKVLKAIIERQKIIMKLKKHEFMCNCELCLPDSE